jgi:hypothetical protein
VLDQFPVIRDAPAVPRPQLDQVRARAGPLSRNRPPGNLILSDDHGRGKTWDILHAVRAAYEDRFTGTAVYTDRELWLRARPTPTFAEHDSTRPFASRSCVVRAPLTRRAGDAESLCAASRTTHTHPRPPATTATQSNASPGAFGHGRAGDQLDGVEPDEVPRRSPIRREPARWPCYGAVSAKTTNHPIPAIAKQNPRTRSKGPWALGSASERILVHSRPPA